jgi:N-carbamoylputrescine amidase
MDKLSRILEQDTATKVAYIEEVDHFPMPANSDVAAVNRIGQEKNSAGGGLEFWGNSHVLNTYGGYLHHSKEQKEEVIVTSCSRKMIEETRRNWPFFRDRRVDFYKTIL